MYLHQLKACHCHCDECVQRACTVEHLTKLNAELYQIVDTLAREKVKILITVNPDQVALMRDAERLMIQHVASSGSQQAYALLSKKLADRRLLHERIHQLTSDLMDAYKAGYIPRFGVTGEPA